MKMLKERDTIMGAFVVATALAILFAILPVSDAAVKVDPSPFVYNTAAPSPMDGGIARGKTVTLGLGTTLAPGGLTDPKQLVEGANKDAALSSAAPWKAPVYFTVDLGKPRDIATVRMTTFDSSDWGAWNNQGKVLVSDDGVEFTLLADGLRGCGLVGKIGGSRTYTDGGTVVINGSLDGVYAARHTRYVRFEAPNPGRDGAWKIAGIEIRTDAGLVVPRAVQGAKFAPAWRTGRTFPV